jgi:hypothetical protein
VTASIPLCPALTALGTTREARGIKVVCEYVDLCLFGDITGNGEAAGKVMCLHLSQRLRDESFQCQGDFFNSPKDLAEVGVPRKHESYPICISPCQPLQKLPYNLGQCTRPTPEFNLRNEYFALGDPKVDVNLS